MTASQCPRCGVPCLETGRQVLQDARLPLVEVYIAFTCLACGHRAQVLEPRPASRLYQPTGQEATDPLLLAAFRDGRTEADVIALLHRHLVEAKIALAELHLRASPVTITLPSLQPTPIPSEDPSRRA